MKNNILPIFFTLFLHNTVIADSFYQNLQSKHDKHCLSMKNATENIKSPFDENQALEEDMLTNLCSRTDPNALALIDFIYANNINHDQKSLLMYNNSNIKNTFDYELNDYLSHKKSFMNPYLIALMTFTAGCYIASRITVAKVKKLLSITIYAMTLLSKPNDEMMRIILPWIRFIK
jgi:hypothetical protein